MLNPMFRNLMRALVLSCALLTTANFTLAQTATPRPTPPPGDPTRPPGQDQIPESARPQTQNPQAPPGAPQTNPATPPGTIPTSPTTVPGTQQNPTAPATG